jgi:3-oxoacyl-[acyl-carrier protein] reductase
MVSSNSLNGKFAIVTGASSGIGAATSLELARRGASVVIHYFKDSKGAERVRKEAESFGVKAFCVSADLSLETDRVALKDKILKLTKKVDILVNNAGFFDDSDSPEVSSEVADRLFAVHSTAVLRLCALLKPSFSKDASVINVASISGMLSRPYSLAYSASKAGVISLTQGLAQSYAPVRVNSVSPGPVDTSMWDTSSKKEKAVAANNTLLKRFGRPEEIAAVIVFLASDESSYITGANILVDGGALLR